MLSKIELNVLSFLYHETQRNGFCPALREGARAVNRSHETVRQCIISLERKGFVRRLPDKPRAVAVIRLPAQLAGAA
jgi:SOS-response transcriptional repressor LexA